MRGLFLGWTHQAIGLYGPRLISSHKNKMLSSIKKVNVLINNGQLKCIIIGIDRGHLNHNSSEKIGISRSEKAFVIARGSIPFIS